MLISFDLDLNTVIAVTFVTCVLYKIYCYVFTKWISFNEKLTNMQNKYQRIERNFENICLTANKVMTKADTYLDNQKKLHTVNLLNECLVLFQQILKVSNDVASLMYPTDTLEKLRCRPATTSLSNQMPEFSQHVFNHEAFLPAHQDELSFSDCSCFSEKKMATQSVKPEQPEKPKKEYMSNSSSSVASSLSKSSNNDKIIEQFTTLADHMFQQQKTTEDTEYDEINN